MAVVRARSSPPYALIVFVFLTVIFAGFTIYFAVKMGDLTKAAADAQSELAKLQKPNERSLVEQFIKGGKDTSAVGGANTQVQQLKKLIEGGTNRSTAEVIVDGQRALVAGGKPDGNLEALVTDLTTKLKGEQTAAASLRDQVKALEDKATQEAATNTSTVAAASQNNGKLQDQLTAAQNDVAKERAEKEANATAAEAAMTKAGETAETAIRLIGLKLEQANANIAKDEQIIRQLRGIIQVRNAPQLAAKPAGTIVRAAAGTGECYIDLGAKDHVMVGLTFAVYDARTGIRAKVDDSGVAGDLLAQGKGGIEVLEVGPTESLCRIEQTTPGQSIQAGDLISNPVFQNSRKHKTHYVVFGDFDLDGDGVATSGEYDRVVHMITAAGGIIDTDLTPQTDFLVLGAKPASPMNRGDEQVGSADQKRIDMRGKYDGLVAAAKESSVPILNANRFLAMVGYYDTTIAR